MIVASNLTKRYPGGSSDAGKTTLVKPIAAIERPTAGSLVVGG